MNLIRAFTGYGHSKQNDTLALEPVTLVKEIKIQISYEIHLKTITKGDREITKLDIIRQLLLEYRGPSEKRALFELGTVLSHPSWVKNKMNNGFGFRGLFNVISTTENMKLDDMFSYERFFIMDIKGWTFTCDYKIETCKTNKGSNFYRVINEFNQKIQSLRAVKVENGQLILT
ncbi:matrix [Kolongo virus]|uniref:Matrix n=1 Tax=Kolongo virus TaxID=380436 RepID=A0AAE9BMG9_9RHAB|nr:matrix [Kolongo virus]UAU42882.1 matrix [Kolongo virus]WAD86859.1 matrix [Kolongo virus]